MHAHTLKYYFHGPAAAAAGRRCVCVSRYRDFTSGPPGRRAGPGGTKKQPCRLRCNLRRRTRIAEAGPQGGPREEDTKGARRMPWHRKSTKDAASCDKPRGGAHGPRSGDLRMGEPARGHALAPPPEPIGRTGATRGTETSKYPEEEKSTEIPRVAASESGPSPNLRTRIAWRRCGAGVAGPGAVGAPDPPSSDKGRCERNGMERPAAAGESPVREAPPLDPRSPSTAGHVKPGGKQGGPPSKAEHSPMTDSGRVP